MRLGRAAAVGAGAAGGGALYLLERAAAARWRVGAEELAAAGLSLPPDIRHHFVPTSDGGRVHAVERGAGPTTVLVHGIMLGVAAWARQLHALPGRVIAVSQRGHGQSRAGAEGFSFDRLAADLSEVLEVLDVRDAALVGHSMGGIIAQLLALSDPDLSRRVRELVLVATAPGPIVPSPLSGLLGAAAVRAIAGAQRSGRGLLPRSATLWAARMAFGASPSPPDVELLRQMLDAMSPRALAALVPHLVSFDVRGRLGALSLPVHVVAGSRDVLTPPHTARAIVERVPRARLTLLAGCGHMVMLERPDALRILLTG